MNVNSIYWYLIWPTTVALLSHKAYTWEELIFCSKLYIPKSSLYNRHTIFFSDISSIWELRQNRAWLVEWAVPRLAHLERAFSNLVLLHYTSVSIGEAQKGDREVAGTAVYAALSACWKVRQRGQCLASKWFKRGVAAATPQPGSARELAVSAEHNCSAWWGRKKKKSPN